MWVQNWQKKREAAKKAREKKEEEEEEAEEKEEDMELPTHYHLSPSGGPSSKVELLA